MFKKLLLKRQKLEKFIKKHHLKEAQIYSQPIYLI